MNKHCNALWEPMIKAGEAGGGGGSRGGEKEKRKGREERGAAESFLSTIRERFRFLI